jgi:hypothetical protein
MTETAEAMHAAGRTQSLGYKIGWWFLVGITGLSIVSHVSLAGFAEGATEVFVFFSLAAINIYALAVLLTAYRRGERWAWWVTWVMVAIYALTTLQAPDEGRYYLGTAVVMGAAQLLTLSSFRRNWERLAEVP